jgi:protein-ribulosamine 3-kinase
MPAEVIKSKLIEILSEVYKESVVIQLIETVSGGDINYSYKVSTTHGDFFLKWNNKNKYPEMFEAEAKGLSLLKKTKTLRIPEIVAYDEIADYSFLVLEFINSGKRNTDFWENFGIKLAELHRNTAPFFGLDFDNYIGSLPQSNEKRRRWPEFYIEKRLQPMINIAMEHKSIDRDTILLFDKFFAKADEIFPLEPSSLLHGDLWSGNFITAADGSSCLIDPAVYYGHRETDIAMTKLFGGFDSSFYDAYNEAFPMEKGWQQRMDYFMLYPLMVHLNLFGSGYLNAVKSILQKV